MLRVLLLAAYVGSIQVAAVNSCPAETGCASPSTRRSSGRCAGLVVLIPLGHWFGSAGVGMAYLVAVVITTAGPLGAAWRRYDMAWAGPIVRSLAVVLAALIVAEVARLAA